MGRHILLWLLLFTSLSLSAQDSSFYIYNNPADQKITLKESPVWVKINSEQPIPLNLSRDSIYRTMSFKRKAFKAAKIILGGELAVMGFFAAMPEDFSNWNKNFYKDAPTHWKNAFTMPPKWDDDPIIVNYIQHPLGGAIYYNGVRSQGATQLQSFLYSFAESTFFEYFIESVAERPSIQDLIVTPIGGYILGELQHRATLLMKRNGFNFPEKILVFLLNPMYVVFNGYKH